MRKIIKNIALRLKIYDFLVFFFKAFQLIWVYFTKAIPFRKKNCDEYTARCSEDILNVNYKYTMLGSDSPVCCNTHLYEILRDVCACLEKNEIEYFIFYGTYLGAVRHSGGFVPWDTDVDLCIMDANKEVALKVIYHELGFRYPVNKVNEYCTTINYSPLNSVHVDLYFLCKNNEYIFLKGYSQYQYKYNDIFPLIKVKMYDLELFAPNNTDTLLTRYGESCLTNKIKQYALIKKSDEGKSEFGRINTMYEKKPQ